MLFMIIGVLTLNSVSAVNECRITDVASCTGGDVIVLRMSDITNAHAELASEVNYNTVLCCNFGGPIACTSVNKIVGLSAVTNAHIEAPNQSAYANNICYDGIECQASVSACSGGFEEVLSLSDSTNAHIGSPGDYPILICCNVTSIIFSCDLTSAVWDREFANTSEQVFLNVQGTNCDGQSVSFEIWESDVLDDDNVTFNPVDVSFVGNDATGSWITEWQADCGGACNPPEFYYNVSLTSNSSEWILSSDPKLEVFQTIATNIPPNASIIEPLDRDAHFLLNTINFSHQSEDIDGTIDSVRWDFGGSVNIDGESGTFTTFTLTGSNVTKSLNVTYITAGQKTIMLTVTDNCIG